MSTRTNPRSESIMKTKTALATLAALLISTAAYAGPVTYILQTPGVV